MEHSGKENAQSITTLFLRLFLLENYLRVKRLQIPESRKSSLRGGWGYPPFPLVFPSAKRGGGSISVYFLMAKNRPKTMFFEGANYRENGGDGGGTTGLTK